MNQHEKAEEKCEQLEEHLNKAAHAAEQMNMSLSSSTLSVDKIHEISDNEETLIKLRAELAEIKRQNKKYIQSVQTITKKHDDLYSKLEKTRDELEQTQSQLMKAQSKIVSLESQTLTDISLGRSDTKEIERLKKETAKLQTQLAQKDYLLETSSNISSDKDIQSHMDQSQAEFEMYEDDIRELKAKLEAKNEEITKLQATNKALLGKKTKSEIVDDEIASNLQAIHDSSSSMSDEEKAKLEMINELRYILEEPELESPRSLSASVPGELHESEPTASEPKRASVSSTDSELERLQDILKNRISLLDSLIRQNKGVSDNVELAQINDHLLEVYNENMHLREDIQKREATLKGLIRRYDQSERKVREFFKNTLRTIMERQKRIHDNQMDDSRQSEVFHL